MLNGLVLSARGWCVPDSKNPLTLKWRRRSFGLDNPTARPADEVCPSCDGNVDMVETFRHNQRKAVCPECGYVKDLMSAAFAKPVDAWKNISKTKSDHPPMFDGQSPLWESLSKRIGHDSNSGVLQQFPVIGGRRRYHHRPLSSWKLSNGKVLTITSDEMEGKVWNRLKGKNNDAFPRIYDVFSVAPANAEKQWAIVHEAMTYPIPDDWEFFVDSFFKWRAMQHGGLHPTKEEDIVDFLRYVLDPEVANPKTLKRARTEAVLPWAMTKSRRKATDTTRTQLLRDQTLQQKIQWAKAVIKFLSQNKILFRDFDPSNLGLTKDGVVVTNLAESRSGPAKSGRMGKVSGSADTLQKTASALNILFEGEPISTLEVFSSETRLLLSLIHEHEPARLLIWYAAFGDKADAATLREGMLYLRDLSKRVGGKATKLLKNMKG